MKVNQTDRLGVSIVEEHFTRCGYVFREQTLVDCGIDAHIEPVNDDIATGQLIALQIKSGNSWFKESTPTEYVYRGDNNHLKYWLDHSLPVIIVLCNIETRNCYWQAIVPSKIIKTDKAWKISIPKFQRINAGMNIDLNKLIKKISAFQDYTIVSTEDASHGVAKRYSLKIVLNKEHTQAEIIELIKTQTKEAIYCEYHRSDMVRRRWRNQPAHVIWLLIYPSSEDHKNNNHLCRSEWISPELDSNFAPISNGGEELSNNLCVLWNDNYLLMAQFRNENSMNKETFVLMASKFKNQIIQLVNKAVEIHRKYQNGSLVYKHLQKQMTRLFPEIDEINAILNDSEFAPYECKEAETKLLAITCYVHNIYLPFSGIGNWEDENYVIYTIESQIDHPPKIRTVS